MKKRVCIAVLLAITGTTAEAAIVDYQSTVVVSPVGGPAANGAALLAALAGIAGAAASPALLKIEPGVYDVGATAVLMKEHVDVEGSGRTVTLIRGEVDGAFPAALGVVTVVDHSELRSLTVENTASGAALDTAAIVLRPGASGRDLEAIASGTADINRAILATPAFLPGTVPPSLSSVTATAATRAVQVVFPGLEANDLTAVGEQGLLVSSGPVSLRNSIVRGVDFSLLVTSLPPRADIVSTQLDGAVTCPPDVCRCVGAYDGELRRLEPECNLPPGRRPF